MNYNWFSSTYLAEEKMKYFQEAALRERQVEMIKENERQMETFSRIFLALTFSMVYNR
jgi:hypothetical protein